MRGSQTARTRDSQVVSPKSYWLNSNKLPLLCLPDLAVVLHQSDQRGWLLDVTVPWLRACITSNSPEVFVSGGFGLEVGSRSLPEVAPVGIATALRVDFLHSLDERLYLCLIVLALGRFCRRLSILYCLFFYCLFFSRKFISGQTGSFLPIGQEVFFRITFLVVDDVEV